LKHVYQLCLLEYSDDSDGSPGGGAASGVAGKADSAEVPLAGPAPTLPPTETKDYHAKLEHITATLKPLLTNPSVTAFEEVSHLSLFDVKSE
jgi:hypothetical protein